jgi:hypothetical protein
MEGLHPHRLRVVRLQSPDVIDTGIGFSLQVRYANKAQFRRKTAAACLDPDWEQLYGCV